MRIQEILSHGDDRPRILFFLGYAFRPDCLANLDFDGYDLTAVFDYSSLEFDVKNLAPRKNILVAWSMGVWAANRVLKDVPLERAIAINGTPYGIHEIFGIPPKAFKKSIDQFDFTLFQKWCLLSDLGKAEFQFPENPKAELETLYAAASEPVEENVRWDKAIVSSKDLVFPHKASACFRCPVQTVNAPHFPFFKFRAVEEILAL